MDSWPTMILMVAITLLVMEIFIPSGGVLGFLSGLAFIVAIGAAYVTGGVRSGTLHLLGVALLLPPVMYGAIKIWPNTYFGRLILIQPPTKDETVPDAQQSRRKYLGHIGMAVTPLLPAGAIRVGDRTIDAISDGVTIEKGTPVEVVAVRGTHLIVRPTTRRAVEPVESPERTVTSDSSPPSDVAPSVSVDVADDDSPPPVEMPPDEMPTQLASNSTSDVSDRTQPKQEPSVLDEPTEAARNPDDFGEAADAGRSSDSDSAIDHRRFDEGLDDVLNDPEGEARA